MMLEITNPQYSNQQVNDLAGGQFWKAYSRGKWHHFWSTLTGRDNSLQNLNEIADAAKVGARHYAGLRTVPIDQIRGSRGRHHDFDAYFHPRDVHSRDRWIGVAAARYKGVSLPPVELIQIGDAYFVLDGHHRISVARSSGQLTIDAQVTIWQN